MFGRKPIGLEQLENPALYPDGDGEEFLANIKLRMLHLQRALQTGFHPDCGLDRCDAPSLAMSMYAAEERDSQPAQRDELAHSRIVPTRGGVLPPANDPSPTAITENTGSQQSSSMERDTLVIAYASILACLLWVGPQVHLKRQVLLRCLCAAAEC